MVPYGLCDRLTVGGLGATRVGTGILDLGRLGSTGELLLGIEPAFFSRVLLSPYGTWGWVLIVDGRSVVICN